MTEVVVREVNLFMSRNNTKSTHIYYSVAYLNRIASMVAPKDEKVRVMLLRIFFSLFKKILKQDEKEGEDKPEAPTQPFRKDRNKSKKENSQAARKTTTKAKSGPGVELEQEDNKVAELVLKGVNILMSKCQA